MSVTEKLMAQGSFNVQLDYNKLPNSVLNSIDAWDQIVIVPSILRCFIFLIFYIIIT